MKQLVMTLAVALVMALPADATIQYLAPDGTDSGAALTEATAWRTIAYALSTSSSFSAGDTLLLCSSVTGAPGIGRWRDGDEPYQYQPAVTKSGTEDEPTTIMPDTLVTPIFDADARTGSAVYAFRFRTVGDTQRREGYLLRGIVFEDYGDGATTGTNGIIQIENTGTDIEAGNYTIEKCSFTAVDVDSTNQLLRASATGAGQCWIDGITFTSNKAINCGNTAIYFSGVKHATIENVQLVNPTPWLNGPNGIQMVNFRTRWIDIKNVTIEGFNNAIVLRGRNINITNTRIDGCRANGILMTGSSFPVRHVTIEETQIMNVGDDGISVVGQAHLIDHNTIYNTNDPTAAWFVFVQGCTLCVITGNIMADSNTNDAVYIGANSTTYMDGNQYWDTEVLRWQDVDQGINTTSFPVWQSAGYDARGTVRDPAFANPDTTRPNLHPTPPGMWRSIPGARTTGALPCRWCYWFATDSGNFGSYDSIATLVTDPLGYEFRFPWGSTWPRGDGHVLDVDVWREEGQWIARFDGWRNGRVVASQHDGFEVKASIDDVWSYDPRTVGYADSVRAVSLVDSVSGGGGDIDYATVADSVWNPTSAAHRWRTIHSADSVAWNQGSGAFLGDIVTRDAGTLGRVPYASVRVFADPARLLAIGNLTTALNGTRGYAYEPNQTYYFTGWAKGYQTTDAQYKPQSDGFVFNIDLNTIDVPITTDPELCTVTVQTIDFQGIAVDSILVEATFEGSGANTGDLILSYSSVSCITDAGGFCGVDLVRSVEIDTPDRIDTYTFTMTDQRVPTTFAPITFRRITVPDQASANLGDLVP